MSVTAIIADDTWVGNSRRTAPRRHAPKPHAGGAGVSNGLKWVEEKK